MPKIALFLSLALSVVVAGCSSVGTINGVRMGATATRDNSFCSRQPAICILAGVAIVGGAVVLIRRLRDDDNGNGNSAGQTGGGGGGGDLTEASDARLKRDIKYLTTTKTGIKLYAFRYLHDGRYFVGAMAQDLLKDPRYRHAVVTDKNGFYKVAYGKIGMTVLGSEAMHAAAARALLTQ